MILLFLRLIAAVVIAIIAGKLISKIKLPAILGWLLAGMIAFVFLLLRLFLLFFQTF